MNELQPAANGFMISQHVVEVGVYVDGQREDYLAIPSRARLPAGDPRLNFDKHAAIRATLRMMLENYER